MVYLPPSARLSRRRGPTLRLGRPVHALVGLAAIYAVGILTFAALWPNGGVATGIVALAGFGVASGVVGRMLTRDFPHDRLGVCNAVTLARMAMVAALALPILSGAGASWAVVLIAAAALSLDGLDGWLARRQAMVSAFGARFDMEVDAALGLVLAFNAAISSAAGFPAILLGLPRYAFAAAGVALPWMRRDLPDRDSRKVVCVVQLGTLIALQAPVFPAALAGPVTGVAAVALAWSFGRDVLWLWRRRKA